MQLLRDTYLEIDIDQFEENLNQLEKYIKNKSPKTKILPILKGDAYGHGAIKLADICIKKGYNYIGVSSLNEAMELRKKYEKLSIFIVSYISDKYLKIAVENNISVTIHTYEQAKYLEKIAINNDIIVNVNIKLDTGFHRLGFVCDDVSLDIIQKISLLKNLNIQSIFSHLTYTSLENDFNQIKKFNYMIDELNKMNVNIEFKHIFASLGLGVQNHELYDYVRLGALMYGYKKANQFDIDVKPIVKLKSKVTNIVNVKKGDKISYDEQYFASKDFTTATISIGYADGIHQNYSKGGYVIINSKKAYIVSQICMDQLIVDIDDFRDEVKIGDEVIIIDSSSHPNIEEIANICGIGRNEVITSISKRVPKVYVSCGNIVDVYDDILK